MTAPRFVTDPDVLAHGCTACSSPEGIALIDPCDEGPPVCLSCYREMVADVAIDDERLVQVKRELRVVPREGRTPADCLPVWSASTHVVVADLDRAARVLGPRFEIWVTPQTGESTAKLSPHPPAAATPPIR